MSDLERVVVLAGGLSYEREISLRSGRRVRDALQDAGVEVALLDADADLVPALQRERPDAVLVALHGAPGEDGSTRAVLELMGIPFVGSSAAACRSTWDKPTARSLAAAAGLTVPDGYAVPQTTFRDLGAARMVDLLVARLGLPLMVKPAQGGSALGASAVSDAADLPAALVACFSYAGAALVERFVEGTEVAVSVIDLGDGPRALPPVEIAPHEGIFDYAARYTPGRTDYHAPARVSSDAEVAVRAAAVTAHQALGLRDLSRMDAVLTRSGEVVFLEVNTSPGLTEVSLLPMALRAEGLELGVVVRDLLQQAVARA
jgi:D-alanine-D-alanine ligase